MDFSAFLTSLVTSFIIFVVLMLVFTWLSRKPGNAVIYFPNRILRGCDPLEGRRRTRNPVAWIVEAIKASEDDIVAAAGVDAATYLIFLGSVLSILVFSGILLLPILLPLAATDDGVKTAKTAEESTTSVGTFNTLDNLAIGNVNKKSKRLWAFMLGVYWVSFVTYYVLWKAYKHVSDMRAAAKSSQEVKPEEYAILVRDIPSAPPGQTMKEHVDSYFKALHPDTFYRSLVVTDNKKVHKLWQEIEGYRKKIAHAEAVYAESKSSGKPEETRPTNRTGFLGLIGEKVDTIDYYNEKIKELLPKLEDEQKHTAKEKQQAAAIVFFNSRPAAVSASQTIHALMIDTWTVMEAPEPRQLLWTNLPKNFYERQIRSCTVYFVVFLTVTFYMIPIAAISAFTTLENLKKYLPFTKSIVDQPQIKTVLEAYLPQLALIVFMALLPTFLMFLSKEEGIPSESHAVRATSGKYFYFIVLNVFLGVTIGGALFNSMKTIVKKPSEAITLLGSSLPKSATFFMTFVALKFFVGYGLELSRLVPLIIFHLKKKYLCKTEEEVKEAWAPGDFGYATRIPNDMLVITIVLCYAVIAPIIIPFGVIYFGLGWIIARNQALNVTVPKYESNGRMWPHMQARIVAALIIYQITMFGYLGILREFVYAPFLLPLIAASFIFSYVCKSQFYLAFYHTPLEVASRGTKQTLNLESVYVAYLPPCFSTEKLEESENFEDAHSYSLRTTSL